MKNEENNFDGWIDANQEIVLVYPMKEVNGNQVLDENDTNRLRSRINRILMASDCKRKGWTRSP